MLRFVVSDHLPAAIAAGFTLGDRHRRLLVEALQTSTPRATIAVVDFVGVEGATASYLKGFLLPLLGAEEKDSCWRQLTLVVANVSADIAEDLRAALTTAETVCLEALEWNGPIVRSARLHGSLEPTISQALAALLSAGGATAGQLQVSDRSVGVTGWHYRLGELCRLGLATRVRSGRSWIYQPTVMEVVNG